MTWHIEGEMVDTMINVVTREKLRLIFQALLTSWFGETQSQNFEVPIWKSKKRSLYPLCPTEVFFITLYTNIVLTYRNWSTNR